VERKAKKTILPNGIRVLTLPMKSRQGVAAGRREKMLGASDSANPANRGL